MSGLCVCDSEGYCEEITSLFGRSLFWFVMGQIPNPAETRYLIIYMNGVIGSTILSHAIWLKLTIDRPAGNDLVLPLWGCFTPSRIEDGRSQGLAGRRGEFGSAWNWYIYIIYIYKLIWSYEDEEGANLVNVGPQKTSWPTLEIDRIEGIRFFSDFPVTFSVFVGTFDKSHFSGLQVGKLMNIRHWLR